MPRLGTMLAVLLCAACLTAAGCGSASRTPREVQVSLTAPTDGAIVNVSKIDVLGTISPTNAVLFVSGRHVHVVGGAFKQLMFLRRGLTRIRIVATAKGFVRSSIVVSVRYNPDRAVPQADGGGSAQGIGGGPSPTFTPSGGGPQTGGGLPPGDVSAAISSCANASGGNTAGCTCVFERLTKQGFNTEAKWQAVLDDWRRSFLARGQITYPPVMKSAIVACATLFRGH